MRPGDRVGLIFDDALWSYVAMLATLKINAAYVPLDAAFPADRLAYIVGDARVSTVLTVAASARRGWPRPTRWCSAWTRRSRRSTGWTAPGSRPDERGEPVEELCYIIYTSGTTGRPKGVAIEHAAICNFVRVAAQVYGMDADDRMYQGLTIAFDFSVEEIWVPLLAGATLVPKPGRNLLGEELADYLRAQRVTALCCVPTLLATMDDVLPELRFLLVSGEACPQDLVAPLAPARPPVPQRVRPDRGHGHRDLDQPAPRPAGDHRRAAAHLLGGDPGRGRAAGRCRPVSWARSPSPGCACPPATSTATT